MPPNEPPTFNCTEASPQDIADVLSEWGPSLSDTKRDALALELNIEGRDIYIVKNEGSGESEAVFDLQNVRGLYSKNLVIYFSPKVVQSGDGLSPEEVNSAGQLLVAIFMELIVLSTNQELKKIKIQSQDKVLLACFLSFATYLASEGGWKARAYRNWIELEHVSLEAVT